MAALASIKGVWGGASADGTEATIFRFGDDGRMLMASAGPAQTLTPPADRQSVKIIETVTPAFPLGLPEQGFFEGEARIAIAVDETGKLTDWLVVGYSHRRFAEESVVAMKQWKFEPAVKGGKRVACKMRVPIRFQAT